MDISTYVRGDNNKPLNYSLKGIVIHAGTSESGHYYSLIKENNDWYKFNDQTVSLFNISDIGR
jgi:ubiquitin C-terminal hydrolase